MEDLIKIFENIKKEHPDFEQPNMDLLQFKYSNNDKTEYIETIQETCNKAYEAYGFDDNILDLQVYINQLRHQYDVTDPREIIHVDNGKGFVQ